MQDTQTGRLIPIEENTQEARDKALPRERQGPVFQMGEEVVLKGGKFRVSGITSKRIYLDSIPA